MMNNLATMSLDLAIFKKKTCFKNMAHSATMADSTSTHHNIRVHRDEDIFYTEQLMLI